MCICYLNTFAETIIFLNKYKNEKDSINNTLFEISQMRQLNVSVNEDELNLLHKRKQNIDDNIIVCLINIYQLKKYIEQNKHCSIHAKNTEHYNHFSLHPQLSFI